MKREIFNRLSPLWDIVSAVEELIKENEELREENIRLKERLDWHERTLEENTKRSGKAVGDFVKACLNGRITINENNETVIKPE